jgi:ATP-dependent Lon protease
VEKFVSTPELHEREQHRRDPLEPGQVWVISPGGQDEPAGLYRIEATDGPGSGVKILNRPAPAAFVESVKYAEQNLYARARELVGDRDPRGHEFSLQLRAFDASKAGRKSLRGGLIVVGEINLGGSIEPIHNAVNIAEIAVEKGAQALLVPVSCRRQLYDLSDDMATKVDIQFYQDARDALLKALVE